jgi:DNA polymerase III subunit delta'
MPSIVINRPRKAATIADGLGAAARAVEITSIGGVLAELDRHPHARAVIGPALTSSGRPSHAYLFHGPAGAGKRTAARALAAELLAAESPNPESARARARSGAHPDLTWVRPSGAHEMLVADIDGPVIGAASRTPFESARRVFVIERAHTLNDEGANRMLKTLEEPAPFVHLILLTDKLVEVLPTIVSRCQLVRFEAPSVAEIAARLEAAGAARDTAAACARLALGDGERAGELAAADGAALRAGAERLARGAISGAISTVRPWTEILTAVRTRGESAAAELEARLAEELELSPRKERKRIETDFAERTRRMRRRAETAALDLALALVALWYRDLMCLAWGAPELVHNVDRSAELEDDNGRSPDRLRAAVELVQDTRERLQFNVSAELACEALGYRLESILAGA